MTCGSSQRSASDAGSECSVTVRIASSSRPGRSTSSRPSLISTRTWVRVRSAGDRLPGLQKLPLPVSFLRSAPASGSAEQRAKELLSVDRLLLNDLCLVIRDNRFHIHDRKQHQASQKVHTGERRLVLNKHALQFSIITRKGSTRVARSYHVIRGLPRAIHLCNPDAHHMKSITLSVIKSAL